MVMVQQLFVNLVSFVYMFELIDSIDKISMNPRSMFVDVKYKPIGCLVGLQQ